MKDPALNRLASSGLKAFTVWDVCDLLGPNKNTARKRLRRFVKKGLIYRSDRRFTIYKECHSIWLYSLIKDPQKRNEEYGVYLYNCMKKDAPDAAKSFELMMKGTIYPSSEFYRHHKYQEGAGLLFGLVDLGILRVLEKDGRKYVCSADVKDITLGATPKRSKRFKTVSEMIRLGYCKTRSGKITKIPRDARIGIPDDDLILTPKEISEFINAVEPTNFRDHLFLGMMFRTGARLSQNLSIRIDDIDLVQGRVFIRSAKEGISFYRYLDDGFLAELAEYVKKYNLKGPDYLFCIRCDYKGNLIKIEKHMGRKNGGDVFYKYAEKAGIQYRYVDVNTGELRRRIHPHSSKYTFCSMAYDKNPSMLTVALTVGNKTIYPMMKSYIKVPTTKRHACAKGVIDQLTEGEIFPTPKIEINDIQNEKQQRENTERADNRDREDTEDIPEG